MTPFQIHFKVRRSRSFENSLTSAGPLTVRFQEDSLQPPQQKQQPPRPVSPKPAITEVVTSLVEDKYGYSVQKEIMLRDVPDKGDVTSENQRISSSIFFNFNN
jgi:hypothetical protein